jgi:hypothetical protein
MIHHDPRVWPDWKDGEVLFSQAQIQVIGHRNPDRVTLESPWIWTEADWKDYAYRAKHVPVEWVRHVLLEKLDEGKAAEQALSALSIAEAIIGEAGAGL